MIKRKTNAKVIKSSTAIIASIPCIPNLDLVFDVPKTGRYIFCEVIAVKLESSQDDGYVDYVHLATRLSNDSDSSLICAITINLSSKIIKDKFCRIFNIKKTIKIDDLLHKTIVVDTFHVPIENENIEFRLMHAPKGSVYEAAICCFDNISELVEATDSMGLTVEQLLKTECKVVPF